MWRRNRSLRAWTSTLTGSAPRSKQLDTAQLAQIVAVLLRAQEDGKSIFTMGNGGHGNTAAHMINDIAKHSISSDDKDSVSRPSVFARCA